MIDREKTKKLLCNALQLSTEEELISQTIEGELTAESLKQDILKNITEFAYLEGLPEHKIISFVRFYQEFLQQTAGSALPLDKAVNILREKMKELALNELYNELFLKSCVDYICQSMIQHYNLYVYALTFQREEIVHTWSQVIEAPPYDFIKLSKSVSLDVWEIEEKMKKQEQERERNENELNRSILENEVSVSRELHNFMEALENLCPDTMTFNSITELIKSIIEKHSDLAENELNGVLERSKHDVLYNYEKSKILSKRIASNIDKSNLNIKPGAKRIPSSKKKL